MDTVYVVVIVVGALLLILLLREIVCWYNKTNEIINQLRQLNSNFEKFLKNKENPIINLNELKHTNTTTWKCLKCGAINPLEEYICKGCGKTNA